MPTSHFIEGSLPDYDYSDVLRALRVSVDMLGRIDRAAADLHHELAVFPSARSCLKRLC